MSNSVQVPPEIEKLCSEIRGWLLIEQGRALYELALEATWPIVDIGSFFGRSTVYLAAGSRAGNRVPVYAVDLFTGRLFDPPKPVKYPAKTRARAQAPARPEEPPQSFDLNVERAGVADLIVKVKGRSQEVAARVPERVSVLFIDGDHMPAAVAADYELYGPRVTLGGSIAVHDAELPGPVAVIERIKRDRSWGDARRVSGDNPTMSMYLAKRVAAFATLDGHLAFVWNGGDDAASG